MIKIGKRHMPAIHIIIGILWHNTRKRDDDNLPNWPGLTNTPASNGQFKKRAERFDGRAAMVEIVIGVVVEGLIGQGIVHLIGLGALGDGYCRLPHPISALLFLNFCFLRAPRKIRSGLALRQQ